MSLNKISINFKSDCILLNAITPFVLPAFHLSRRRDTVKIPLCHLSPHLLVSARSFAPLFALSLKVHKTKIVAGRVGVSPETNNNKVMDNTCSGIICQGASASFVRTLGGRENQDVYRRRQNTRK